ncbi:signal peptide-containing protein, putative [Babesia ovata]|uniref:Signal peptide-containing protein, putative n=1 Tax=Babesia ovata TaxID=189622 RepID=A0A2H6K9X0_9APIC|nr:signal peptide-containing protein, putative [Babesia ovata]GBE59794.1 signal peptide-containing protein, putative [Babesia ovata]
MIKAETPLVKPVSVVVYTFWGKESCFNTQLRLDCAVTDTGHSIKRMISALTGIPVVLQRLFVSESVWTLGTRTKFEDNDQISDFPALLRLRHDTKQPELHVLLEIPVPYSHNLRSDAGSIEEYAAALRRYSSLLSRVKAARKDPKILLEPELPTDGQASDASTTTEINPTTGRVGGVDDGMVGQGVVKDGCVVSPKGDKGTGCSIANAVKGTTGTLDGNDTVVGAAGSCPLASAKRAPSTGIGEAGTFVSPNRRMHLLFFHDYPTPPGGIGGRLQQWFNQQLPIDWETNAKFAFMCYLIRATCNNDPSAVPDADRAADVPQRLPHAAHGETPQSVRDERETLGKLRLLVLGQVSPVDASRSAEQLHEVLFANVLAEVGDPDGVFVEAPAVATALLATWRNVFGGGVPVVHHVAGVAVVAEALELHLQLPGGTRHVDVVGGVYEVEVLLLVDAGAPADGLLNDDFVLRDHGDTDVGVLIHLEARHVIPELRSLVGPARNANLLHPFGDLRTNEAPIRQIRAIVHTCYGNMADGPVRYARILRHHITDQRRYNHEECDTVATQNEINNHVNRTVLRIVDDKRRYPMTVSSTNTTGSNISTGIRRL